MRGERGEARGKRQEGRRKKGEVRAVKGETQEGRGKRAAPPNPRRRGDALCSLKDTRGERQEGKRGDARGKSCQLSVVARGDWADWI